MCEGDRQKKATTDQRAKDQSGRKLKKQKVIAAKGPFQAEADRSFTANLVGDHDGL